MASGRLGKSACSPRSSRRLTQRGCGPHHQRRENDLRTNTNRPVKLAFRMNPPMEPLQRGQRLMRMQTVNELQGIRQHARDSSQHDDDDRRVRRRKSRSTAYSIKSRKCRDGIAEARTAERRRVIPEALFCGDHRYTPETPSTGSLSTSRH